MITRSSRSLPRVVATCLLVLSLSACSTSGQNTTADPATSTTTTALTATTTSEPDGPGPTIEATPDPKKVTVADLEALLPTASEVGGTYEVEGDDGDDGDAATEQAVEKACPGIYELFDDTANAAAEVSMEDADQRGFEVRLSPTPRIDEDTVDEQIDAINRCDTITLTDENGSDLSMDLSARRTDDFGDLAVTFSADLSIDNDALRAPLTIRLAQRSFVVGPVSVNVNITDGLDEATLENLPGDVDLLDEYSTEMETRVTDLLAS